MSIRKTVINIAEIASKHWNFIEDYYSDKNTSWLYYSASPQNKFERFISRPNLSRFRACYQATRQVSSPSNIIISHLPKVTHWQSIFMRTCRLSNKHLAFSFNFTQLPTGHLRSSMIKSFRYVDCFVVYSEFERKRYSNYFEIPIEKIQRLYWAMDTPKVNPSFTPMSGEYYCAVGGEGRDYHTLLKAFEKLPNLKLIIVTRPNILDKRNLPSNVFLYYNLSTENFWQVVRKSKAVIVNLIDVYTACGHITFVGSMKLGKAIITSFSHGLTDYIMDNVNGLVVPPTCVDALIEAIITLEQNELIIKTLESNSLRFANTYCTLSIWSNFVKSFIDSA